MLKNNGKAFRIIRESKKFSRSKISDKEISDSQICRFENGENQISLDKFLLLLQNMNVSLDEFQSVSDNYQMSEEFSFRQELKEAYDTRNIHLLGEMMNFWEEKSIKNPKQSYFKINAIVVKAILSHLLSNFRVPTNEKALVIEHLLSIEEWGRYEFWVLGNTANALKDSELRILGSAAMEKDKFYQNITTNKRIAIRTFLNLTETWIKRNNPNQALKYINYLDEMQISTDFFYEKIMLEYNKGWYAHITHHANGLERMKNCANDFRKYGFSNIARNLEEEIRNL